MSRITEAVNWAIGIAVDDSHGYQYGGWGPEYDCGHLIIMAWENAGVHVRSAGATYTGNMRPAFMACGFEDVTGMVNLSSGAGMQIGDVLVNHDNHAAMVIGNGRIVQARENLDGITGDSNGQEIRTQGYYNYPWDCVLRYGENSQSASSSSATITQTTVQDSSPTVANQSGNPTLRRGMTGYAVKRMQELLIKAGEDCGPDGADGEFGFNTYSAVLHFQSANGLNADGIVGPLTWDALEKAADSSEHADSESTEDAHQNETIFDEDDPETSSMYTVVKGDSLWSIAGRQLGNFLRWTEIKKLNGLKSIIIYPGQQLMLPKK